MMNTKRWLKGLVMGIGMVAVGLMGRAWADTGLSPLGDTDTIKLFVTPAVNYGVIITSVHQSGYDFGTVNLNSVTHSTSAILVTNTGNVNENFMLYGIHLATWTLASSAGTDQAMIQGVFASSTTLAEIPDAQFVAGDEILENTPQVVQYS